MESVFEAAEHFLLRAPVLPKNWAAHTPERFGDDLSYARALLSDPGFREALLTSSPSLARAVTSLAAGDGALSTRRRRSVTRSLLRYQLRAAGRPTPFGLLAGVAVGTFGARPAFTLGRRHRKSVRPDALWLNAGLNERESDPEALKTARLHVSDVLSPRTDTVVLPLSLHEESAVRRGIKLTRAVDAVLRHARTPVAHPDLVAALVREFPTVPRDRAVALVATLVRAGVLLTDLRPAPGAVTPPDGPAAGLFHDRLATVYDAMRRFEAAPPGEGEPALRQLAETAGTGNAAHVDLALDARVVLPDEVAREAERAATVLWRLSSPDTASRLALKAYHQEFLERYGVGEVVPLRRLLDPDSGLGAPAGYESPGAHRTAPAGPAPSPARREALATLLLRAVAQKQPCVMLDDDMIDRLGHDGGETPASADLLLSLTADSPDDLRAGRFLLAPNPLTATQRAGMAWGRFAHLPGVEDALTAIVGRSLPDGGDDGPLPVQLAYAPHDPRHGNVLGTRQVLAHRVSAGLFCDGTGENLGVTGIGVIADASRFRLLDMESGREVLPVPLSAHNLRTAPDTARFLHDVAMMDVRTISPWDWDALKDSPYLPEIRYGRTILSPATWRLTAGTLGGEGGGTGRPGDLRAAVRAWQSLWNAPDRLRITEADQQIPVDLSLASHRELLWDECRKGDRVVLHGHPSPDPDRGWLAGPSGFHEAEVVVSVLPRRTAGATPLSAPVRTPPVRTPPPGTAEEHVWLSAFLYGSLEGQQELLAGHVAPWAAALAGDDTLRWFYVRYADPALGRPHLRLRVRAPRERWGGTVVPAFRDWARGLLAAGAVNDVAVHPYRPETERYGGADLMDSAERVFHLDSMLALERLDQHSPARVAPGIVTLVRVFHGENARDGDDWLLRAVPKDEELHRACARQRRDMRQAVGPRTGPPSSELEARWRSALADYGARVRRTAAGRPWTDPTSVLRAVAHMHCNRRLRLAAGRRAEAEVYALARGAVQAGRDRDRAAARRHAITGDVGTDAIAGPA
ncbi:lantibiotic dehydratase [Streptomyces sp. NPDC018964]|uniref:lantibiotic dehydratase n=1 Tax=Streptomyces sp. NPDC018964 TaxID=3365058 RepID=UPI0037BDB0A5